MKRTLLAIFSLVVVATSFADQGGSFFLSDLKDLLAKQNGLWEQLEVAFDIYPAGDASRIGWAQNHELDGTRIGPYRLFAKPKGKSGPFIYEIEIETKQSFYDKSERAVSLGKAVTVREEITAIKVRSLKPTEYFSPTPD